MILVTGATGAVGGMTARFLSEHNESMRLLVRDPARAPELPGTEVAVGDYADPGDGRSLVTDHRQTASV